VLIRRCEIDGSAPLDVRIARDRIVEIGAGMSAAAGEYVVDAAGGALLPGLHDHHLHLFALAAAERSIDCGPPVVQSLQDLARSLSAPRSAGEDWLRGVHYHESVAGHLDRFLLDRLVCDRPLRIQHRSGAAWFLNSRAIELLGLDAVVDAPGIERDASGHATGRLFRCDKLLREAITGEPMPFLSTVSRRLAGYGVTGVTDATATNGKKELRALADASDAGELLQRVVVMGARFVPPQAHPCIDVGAVKILLDEYALPALDDLARDITHAHADGRTVAIHAVTRAELVLACGALEAAGVRVGDRLEHASVMPPSLAEWVANLGVAVVTQPNFVRERGDSYLRDVEPADRAWLYRCRGAIDAGIALGGGTDAPYGEADPWLAMQAAVTRRTRGGAPLGADEALTPERALALFTTPARDPGGRPRHVEVGAVADLCLLDRSWSRARDALSSETVEATFVGGRTVWKRGQAPFSQESEKGA
jgi:predicted amidohydrolase YtcJ